MVECLNLLEESPLVLDERLIASVKLQPIADNAFISFGFDGLSTNISPTGFRLQVILKSFEGRIEHRRKNYHRKSLTMSLPPPNKRVR